MARRIDALQGIDPRPRLEAMVGDVINATPDPHLQALVREAADICGTSIALVSLILEDVQFFRAHVGLPPDLVAVRATARENSFCQFVVRDQQPFEVRDAYCDGRLPTELIERYGLRSYYGVPVAIGQVVVGSLCVIDTRLVAFDDLKRQRLRRLGDAVAERLSQLAARQARPTLGLLEAGVEPAFAEARNRMMPLELAFIEADAAVATLRDDALTSDQRTRALDELKVQLGRIEGLTGELMSGLHAIEEATTVGRGACTVVDLIDGAGALAHHLTKLVGGVRWTGDLAPRSLAVPRPIAFAAVSIALSALAEVGRACPSGITGDVTVGDRLARIELSVECGSGDAAESVVQTFRQLKLNELGIIAEPYAAGLRLTLPLAFEAA